MGKKKSQRRDRLAFRQNSLQQERTEVPGDYEQAGQPSALPPPSEALSLLREMERICGSRVIVFFAYPDVIARGDIPLQIYEQLRTIGHVDRLNLFMHSTGGQTEVPWRIVTLLRDFCSSLSVLIPYRAFSGATQIAMGADEIVMGDMSELGPVDPSRVHPFITPIDGKQVPVSVQDLRQCIEFIRNEQKEYTPEALATIYTALFEKVHPLALGAIQQSYTLARLLTQKALETHMDPVADAEKIKTIVHKFSDEFYSHSYRIGWKEAKDLGLPVKYDNGDLWETMWKLYGYYAAYEGAAKKIADNPTRIKRPIVWIDNTGHRRILEQIEVVRTSKEHPFIQEREAIGAKWQEAEWEVDQESETNSAAPATQEQQV